MDFYPYGKSNAEEVYVGYLRSILDAYAKDRQHDLVFAVTPLKRLFLGFESGALQEAAKILRDSGQVDVIGFTDLVEMKNWPGQK